MEEIIFEEKSHTYTHVETKEIYTSATTLIHKYSQPFDSEFWSVYTAIRHLMGYSQDYQKKQFASFLIKTFGYKYGVQDLQLLYNIAYRLGITEKEVENKRKEINKSWDKTRDDACEKGTLYHKTKEDESYENGIELFQGEKFVVHNYKAVLSDLKTSKKVNYYETLPDGFYPELLVYNNYYKVCGTADKVYITTDNLGNRWIKIDDYKTSRVIHLDNKYQNMKAPLESFPDCNYSHYNLQTSLYAYMLECMGFKIKSTQITWINDEGQQIPFEFEYKKKDVYNMLEHFKNNKQTI